MATNNSDMYLKVVHDELQFPEDFPVDQPGTENLIRSASIVSVRTGQIADTGTIASPKGPRFEDQGTRDQTSSLFLDGVSLWLHPWMQLIYRLPQRLVICTL